MSLDADISRLLRTVWHDCRCGDRHELLLDDNRMIVLECPHCGKPHKTPVVVDWGSGKSVDYDQVLSARPVYEYVDNDWPPCAAKEE